MAGFVVIEFALAIIPFAFLMIRPEATERAVQRFKDWLTGHARQILAAAALVRRQLHGDQRHPTPAGLTGGLPHRAT